ncbi:MAG: histidine kinase [Chitinophagaceae bacterium]|nr:histidine kinase [Chitinophagaceae bacterium]
MKLYRPPGYQLNGFLISMPFITWGWNYILYGDKLYSDWRIWVVSFPLIYLIGVISWYMHYQYDHFLMTRYPSLNQTGKRIFFKLFIYVFVMTPSVLAIFLVYHTFHIFGYTLKQEDLKWGLLIGLIVNLVFETLWEVLYILEKYRENLTEQELLKQMSIEQEFENLKSQVNPHFLFNCFNTLSSLISEDKERAEAFLNELSKVYRYLLNSNTDGVATLQSEIKFIESYLALLKTRHGDALQVQMEIDKEYYSSLLPSLSLQLLVENAVKHNIVSRQQPLVIEIFTTPARQLIVNNNLQRKSKKEKSTRIGLQNIKAKYQLLQEDGFQVVQGEKNFMAVLPLIKNKSIV